MKWIRRVFPTKEQRIFLAAAEKAFTSVCQGDTSAAEIYREHPAVKDQDWKAIRNDLLDLTRSDKRSQLGKRLRGKFAAIVELLVTDHFYTNLDADDRDYFAKFIGSNREVEDRNYYFSLAYNYAYAEMLDFIIFNGWDGDEASKTNLKTIQTTFVDMCKSHCEMGLMVARANAQGRTITEAEKESGKTTIMLKEVSRRALAGEKVFDE